MSLARFISLLITVLLWAAGLYGFMTAVDEVVSYALLAGGLAAGAIAWDCVSDSPASPAKKPRGLERVKNPDVSS